MLNRMWSHILDFISHPVFGIVLTILLLVAGWKMTASGANALLIVAWGIFVTYAFFTGPLPQLELLPRFLWTLLIAGGFGLGIYYTLWTTPPLVVEKKSVELTSSSQPTANSLPISVTGFGIDHGPYEAGKIVHVILRINNLSSNLKLRGGFKIWADAADSASLSLENRHHTEELLWKQFEANPPTQRIPLSWARGDMISTIDGPVLTKEQADRLNGATGIVYIMGQIYYGDGALDFGGYVQTVTPHVGTLAIEHNGPAKKRFFRTMPPS